MFTVERYYTPETIFGHSVGKSDARATLSLPPTVNMIFHLLLGILRDVAQTNTRGAEL